MNWKIQSLWRAWFSCAACLAVMTLSAVNAGAGVSTDSTLQGDGTQQKPLRVAVPLVLTNGNIGYYGQPAVLQVNGGLFGPAITATTSSYTAVSGTAGNNGTGVYGTGTNGYGVLGIATAAQGSGVFGLDQSATTTGFGLQGFSLAGIGLQSGANSHGWGAAIDAPLGAGLVVGSQGSTPSYFYGNVHVYGTLSKSGGSFKIDHPLDPGNKYLSHSFVESPDMMNIYNGNIQTDGSGLAVVALPDWFDALNRDFRYQLTTIGQPAQAWVAAEISGNKFVIRTDKPLVKVSWQVTGVRQDAWANAHRIPVEEAKPEEERGYYLHPELHGQSDEKGILWAQYPQRMRAMKEHAQRVAAQ